MEEWLLLDRVALDAADIPPWHVQLPALIEPHLADPDRPVRDGAFVSTCVASDTVTTDRLDKLGGSLGRSCLEYFTKR
jgi:hypothetical protein